MDHLGGVNPPRLRAMGRGSLALPVDAAGRPGERGEPVEDNRKYVIALGFFDGIHLGHQALLRRTVERSEEHHMRPAVFTFDRSPKEAVTGKPVALLTTPEERIRIVRALFPIDTVIVAPFDRAMMTMDWRDFVDMLAGKYRAGWLVAGHDFRFGHRNAGTPELLRRRAAELGLGCDIVEAVKIGGEPVSSTRIRALLEQGRREDACRLLGHSLLSELHTGKPETDS